ncbi:MAG: hypothetical protein IT280_13380 [Ignavibacteria bacterium]|nr:hypothetical protein [Ignavibacteria bacterium]
MNKHYSRSLFIGLILMVILILSVLVFDFPCRHNNVNVKKNGQTHIYPPHYKVEAHAARIISDEDDVFKSNLLKGNLDGYHFKGDHY